MFNKLFFNIVGKLTKLVIKNKDKWPIYNWVISNTNYVHKLDYLDKVSVNYRNTSDIIRKIVNHELNEVIVDPLNKIDESTVIENIPCKIDENISIDGKIMKMKDAYDLVVNPDTDDFNKIIKNAFKVPPLSDDKK